jgi:hypothetical protein
MTMDRMYLVVAAAAMLIAVLAAVAPVGLVTPVGEMQMAQGGVWAMTAAGDLNGDGVIDFADIAIIAQNWLMQGDPA